MEVTDLMSYSRGAKILASDSNGVLMLLNCPSWNSSEGNFHLIYVFIWGVTSLSTLYRSYHDG